MITNFESPIEGLVDRLFSEIKAKHGECCDLPVTGAAIVWGVDPIRRRRRPRLSRSSLANGLRSTARRMPLRCPLSPHDVEGYRHARGLKGVVGFYARSLARQDYGVRRHPSFEDFARGLMAINTGMWGMEKDENLKKRFPPRPLAGMTDSAFWHPQKSTNKSWQVTDAPAWLREVRMAAAAATRSFDTVGRNTDVGLGKAPSGKPGT
jgi:hypothetical protein